MTKTVEIKQKPTKCPECGNLEIAEIFYGEYREFLKKRDQNIVFGGEYYFSFMPKYLCLRCELEFRDKNI